MSAFTVLIIDDEVQIRRALRRALTEDGARVLEAGSGREGVDIAAAELPDVIVLDLALPDMNGAEVCREIRAWFGNPIIVLSANHSDQEKAALLDAGADDYVTKPFSTIELQARIRAQLRRARGSASSPGDGVIVADGVTIDLIKRSVTRDDQPVHLTPIEWKLLRVLLKHRGRTMTHRQLFAETWTGSHGDAQQYLRVHVASLRRKLERDPLHHRLIITEPGVGYRFD